MGKKEWVCQVLGCGRVLRAKPSLTYHMQTVHSKERPRDFKCNDCDAAYMTEKTLSSHVRNYHTHKKVYKCKFCQKQFKTKTGLEEHAASSHGHKKIFHQCKFCSKTFLRHSSKYSHQKSHEDRIRQKCPSCDLTFISRSTLVKHIARLHSGDSVNKFHCRIDHCQKSFFQPNELKRHEARHNGTGAKFRCYFCPKSFDAADRLANHMLCLHIGEKGWKCEEPLCHFRTNTASKMKYHINTKHVAPIPENPIQVESLCYFCSKPTRNMLLHLQTHTLETPYRCSLCPKQFRTGQHLNELKRFLNGVGAA